MTLFAKLLASSTNPFGYITYIFELLDESDIKVLQYKYISCTRYPNWQCRQLNIGDTGFVDINIVRAGVDTWYDANGKQHIPYRNNAQQFIRFVDVNEESNEEYVL